MREIIKKFNLVDVPTLRKFPVTSYFAFGGI
jgi:hypothetical protein